MDAGKLSLEDVAKDGENEAYWVLGESEPLPRRFIPWFTSWSLAGSHWSLPPMSPLKGYCAFPEKF